MLMILFTPDLKISQIDNLDLIVSLNLSTQKELPCDLIFIYDVDKQNNQEPVGTTGDCPYFKFTTLLIFSSKSFGLILVYLLS